MSDVTIGAVIRDSRWSTGRMVYEDYSKSAITAGTIKREWILPFNGQIVDVLADSETIGGNSNQADIIDININGTTIYTTEGNRPSLPLVYTFVFEEAGEPEVASFIAVDILSYDVDQVDGSGGSARFKLSIVCQGL